MVVVVIYYVGIMFAMLLAVEATLQYTWAIDDPNNHDTTTVGTLFISDGIVYILTVAFMVVAIAQMLVVGTPMANWIITRLNRQFGMDDQTA